MSAIAIAKELSSDYQSKFQTLYNAVGTDRGGKRDYSPNAMNILLLLLSVTL